MGHPEAQIEMRNVHGIRVTGGSFPAQIWAKFMKGVEADYPVMEFAKPEVMVKYDHNFFSRFAVPSTTTTESTTTTTGVTIIFPTTTPTTLTTSTTLPTSTTTATTTTTVPTSTTSTGPTTTG